jgi:hypothetical protein
VVLCVYSIRFLILGQRHVEALLMAQMAGVGGGAPPVAKSLEEAYRLRCGREKLPPQRITPTAEEIRLGRLVPERTEKMMGLFDGQAFAAARREIKDAPAYSLGRAEGDIRNLIDGKRSILRIRNAAAAMAGPVGLKDVEGYLRLLEKAGYVKIRAI